MFLETIQCIWKVVLGSEFKASAVHDQTHVTVICELMDSKLSTERVFLMDRNDPLEECRWEGTQYQCTSGAKGEVFFQNQIHVIIVCISLSLSLSISLSMKRNVFLSLNLQLYLIDIIVWPYYMYSNVIKPWIWLFS